MADDSELPPAGDVRAGLDGRPYLAIPVNLKAGATEFRIPDVFKVGWRELRKNLPFLTLLLFALWLGGHIRGVVNLSRGTVPLTWRNTYSALFAIPNVPSLVVRQYFPKTRLSTIDLIWGFTIAALSFYVGIGLRRIALHAAASDRPSVSDLQSGVEVTAKMIALELMVGAPFLLMVVLFAAAMGRSKEAVCGMALLLVPGFLWILAFCLAPYFVIDSGCGPVEAMRHSARSTRHIKGRIVIFAIAGFGIELAGLLAFGVGALATWWVYKIAIARAYLDLKPKAVEG